MFRDNSQRIWEIFFTIDIISISRKNNFVRVVVLFKIELHCRCSRHHYIEQRSSWSIFTRLDSKILYSKIISFSKIRHESNIFTSTCIVFERNNIFVIDVSTIVSNSFDRSKCRTIKWIIHYTHNNT